MKKFILMAVVAVFALTTASAQDQGKWGVGPKVGVYTHTGDDAIFSIGAAARYSFTDNWRIEPAIAAIFEDHCSVDISADVHYLFNVARQWKVYPLAGFGVNDFGSWSCSINLGAGTDFTLNKHWDFSAGLKWMVQTESGRKNPILISVGATYKF